MEWRDEIASKVIDQMADAVMVVDLYGSIVHVNAELCRRVGYSREHLIGASPSLWHADKDRYGELTREIISECLRDGRWLGHIEFISTTGQRRVSEVLATPLTGESGRVEAILSVSRDVTDRASVGLYPRSEP